jgi:hypothetical protein
MGRRKLFTEGNRELVKFWDRDMKQRVGYYLGTYEGKRWFGLLLIETPSGDRYRVPLDQVRFPEDEGGEKDE